MTIPKLQLQASRARQRRDSIQHDDGRVDRAGRNQCRRRAQPARRTRPGRCEANSAPTLPYFALYIYAPSFLHSFYHSFSFEHSHSSTYTLKRHPIISPAILCTFLFTVSFPSTFRPNINPTTAVPGGQLHVLFGYNGECEQADHHVFDIAARTWSRAPRGVEAASPPARSVTDAVFLRYISHESIIGTCNSNYLFIFK
jgi:hypothetical protein